MNLGELLDELTKIAIEHGRDLPVEDSYGEAIETCEYNGDSPAPCVLVEP